ncbi:MAG: DNA primase [Ignavibacteriales bacterium]|nr:DNA primase [Ignavibacteriales bacterium]
MRFTETQIEDVRSSADIVDVVSQYVKLKKRGKNYIGLCPFHQEKTPSFTVSGEKQMYHCFGCHKGGNVFTFVMEVEKVSFVEAVRSLAQKAGMVLPDDQTTTPEQQTEAENLYNVCRFAAQTFHDNLVYSDEGKFALEYFRKRGFTDETIRAFGLGYTMNEWDAFIQQAKEHGFQPETLVKAGLARTRDDGSLYDYFRGRAMFPIFSATARVIGFGARKIRDDDPVQGKYINSPETPVYNKSRVLFGLSHSKEAIRQQEYALMVEGYADLISLFQSGVQNVVASSGTALTEEQLALLGRYTKQLTLVYDADSAGSNATLRGIDLALEKDFDIRVAELPQGDDPDSFVRKHGAPAFRDLLLKAASFIEFKANTAVKAGEFSSPEGKARAVRSIVQSIAKMRDDLKRNFYIKEVSEKYSIYESTLFRELEHWTGGASRRGFSSPAVAKKSPIGERENQDQRTTPQADLSAAERDLLKLLLEGAPDLVQFIVANIQPSQFQNAAARSMCQHIVEVCDVQGEFDAGRFVQETAEESFRNLATDVVMSKYELSPKWDESDKHIAVADSYEIARAAIRVLHRQEVVRAMEENQLALKQANASGSDPMPLLQRQHELLDLKKRIDHSDYLKS